jgi:hypothetical protein
MAVVIDREEHEAYRWFNINQIPFSKDILWGLPTMLCDFKLLGALGADSTLADGSTIRFLAGQETK